MKTSKRLAKKAEVSPRSQDEAVVWLQKNHPEFFADPETRDMAVVVILSLAGELRLLTPVQQISMVAGVMELMYKMGTAAMQSIGDKKGRKMGCIFVDNYKKLERLER